MAAQGYQESRLDQGAKSAVGAVGVMQVMPATGQELKVGDIHQVDPNIHAGVKYVRFMLDRYYVNEPMDAARQGALHVRLVQRRARAVSLSCAGGAAQRGLEPERLVRKRRACRRREDRTRDRDVRQQHLQVLHRLPARHGAEARSARRPGRQLKGRGEVDRPVRLQ